MTRNEALKKVTMKMGKGFTISKLKDDRRAYLFLAKATDPSVIPSKLVCAVNRESGEMGFSIISVEEAIDACTGG